MNEDTTLFYTLEPEIQGAYLRLLMTATIVQPWSPAAADFVLAWEDAKQFGGFDVSSIASLDEFTTADIATLIPFIQRTHIRPGMLGHGEVLQKMLDLHRPSSPLPTPPSNTN